jgi:SNF2 family DNA or RNA helicase
MRVLHAGLSERSLLLWAEPADAAWQDADTVLAPLRRASNPVTAYLWVPCFDGAPIASTPLVGTAETMKAPKIKARLERTAIECLRLSWTDAVDLLCYCVDKKVLAPGVLIGDDLRFWTNALRFAGFLVHKKAYLPGIRETAGAMPRGASAASGTRTANAFAAVWEPVIDAEDRATSARLAASMPPAARALSMAPDEVPPGSAAAEVLDQFLGGAVDALVRTAARVAKGAGSAGAAGAAHAALARGPSRRAVTVHDSIHDYWLHALRARNATLDAALEEIRGLQRQIAEWREPLSVSVRSPYRLCFRLEEPEEKHSEQPDGGWYVRYLVQPLDDMSLLMPVPEALGAKGRTAFSRRNAGGAGSGSGTVREAVLSALGRASVLSPGVERSLRKSIPDGYALDESGAYGFLASESALLDRAGFGVFLPSWWTRKGGKARLSIGARVKSPALQGTAGMTLDKVLDVRWEVALGGQVLTRKELDSLATLKAPLVKVRGQWVAMSAEEITTALAFWRGKASARMKARDLLSLSLGTSSEVAGMEFSGVQASGWIGELLDRLRGDRRFEELPAPSGFHGILRPYQLRGYSWLSFLADWGLGACLADDMGLGKTVQALAFIQARREQGERNPFLLVCPTSVVANWKKEAARFTPDLPVTVHHGVDRKKGEPLREEAGRQAMVVSTYSLVHRDREHLAGIRWAGVILDEAQNIKNPETRQARAVRSLSAEYRMVLTGTPVENHVGDLWSIMEFLNPGLLGNREEFKRRFFIPIQANRDEAAAATLKRLTGPFILRRVKTDPTVITDLPKKMEMKVWCTITREQATLYKAVVDETENALKSAEGISRKGVILAALTKLKQVLDHPAHFLKDNSSIPGRSGKLQRLTEMLEEVLESGERALIFTQYAEMGEILRTHLEETFGEEVPFLHGGVPRTRRDEMVERFQTDEKAPRFFVLSLKAGGTGLNLTRANHVFHYDRWWNPAVETQATDRVYRIGQKKNVEVHAFICSGTIEEHIDELIERKKEVAGSVIGAGEAWLSELSNSELRKLFQLRGEVQGD